MDYLIKEQDMLDLKMEDHSDQYLFNALLDIGQLQQQSCQEDSNPPYSYSDRENPQIQKSRGTNYEESIIHELSHIYNLRTTPLNDLLAYVEQAYEPTETLRKALFISLKRYKLQLKRQNAKKRNPQVEKCEEIMEEVKLQENMMSSFGFQDESQETKKKKRNRMSAQKSRDRKKEYIKQIQKINKQLKRKIEELNGKSKRRVKPASREFVKVLLCLGITCFLNATPQIPSCSQEIVDEERPSTETITSCEGVLAPTKIETKLDLENYKKLLPMSQQLMLEEALSTMNQGQEPIEIDSLPELMTETSPPIMIALDRGKKSNLGKKLSASSSTT